MSTPALRDRFATKNTYRAVALDEKGNRRAAPETSRSLSEGSIFVGLIGLETAGRYYLTVENPPYGIFLHLTRSI
jgi:hypothetical protein